MHAHVCSLDRVCERMHMCVARACECMRMCARLLGHVSACAYVHSLDRACECMHICCVHLIGRVSACMCAHLLGRVFVCITCMSDCVYVCARECVRVCECMCQGVVRVHGRGGWGASGTHVVFGLGLNVLPGFR